MFDPKKLLDGLLGSQVPGADGTVRSKAEQALQMARDNPLAAGALAAVLLGTKPGRNVAGAAIKLGGLAAIGSLAYRAYQNYQNGKNPQDTPVSAEPELLPPPADTGFHPSQAPQGESEFALVLVRAMIAAAKADGRIDDEERQKIAGRLRPSSRRNWKRRSISTTWWPRPVARSRRSSFTPPLGLPSMPTAGPSAAISTCLPADLACRML